MDHLVRVPTKEGAVQGTVRIKMEQFRQGKNGEFWTGTGWDMVANEKVNLWGQTSAVGEACGQLGILGKGVVFTMTGGVVSSYSNGALRLELTGHIERERESDTVVGLTRLQDAPLVRKILEEVVGIPAVVVNDGKGVRVGLVGSKVGSEFVELKVRYGFNGSLVGKVCSFFKVTHVGARLLEAAAGFSVAAIGEFSPEAVQQLAERERTWFAAQKDTVEEEVRASLEEGEQAYAPGFLPATPLGNRKAVTIEDR